MTDADKDRIRKQLADNNGNIILWTKKRQTLVEPANSVVMRVRDASHFGMSDQGYVREPGEVFAVDWTDALNRY